MTLSEPTAAFAGSASDVTARSGAGASAREAAQILVVPTEGVPKVQSMTAPTSVTYVLVAEQAATDLAASGSATWRADTVRREPDLSAVDVPASCDAVFLQWRRTRPDPDRDNERAL
ncbi:hypothetical protein SUDANB176_00142 [Streptomyces sp. enrichment culture]|uniref:hypothetical protein n=1 Tax=Streptomyces sp. enrichment culture TaxID=1795815 RepID=UPI003F56708A